METEARDTVSSAGEISLLHVDDDRGFAEASAAHLAKIDSNLDIIIETSAQDGLERLAEEDIDCVVSDYQMAEMDGIEFLTAVRERNPELPFILFTGKGSEKVASKALSAGATDYLQKGTTTEQYEILANRVTNAVESYHTAARAKTLTRVRTLVGDINQTLVRASSRTELELDVCNIISSSDPYQFAWIGSVSDDTNRITPRASAGDADGYLDEVTITVGDEPTGQGPAGKALQEQAVVVTQDIESDEKFEPWRVSAMDRGFQSAAAVPLAYEGTEYGVLAVYANRLEAFDSAEQNLLAELGDDIAHALDSLSKRERLREERDRRAALFDEAPSPVLAGRVEAVGGDYPITDANDAFEEIFDFDIEEIRGKDVADVVVPDEGRAEHEQFRERMAAGNTISAEVERITADGPCEFLLTVIPFGTGGDHPDGWYAWYTDISEQRERESELREREAVLRRAHGVTSNQSLTLDEQVEALLALGQTAVGTEARSLSRIEDDNWVLEAGAIPDEASVAIGESAPLDEMPYCTRVIDTEQTIVHQNTQGAGDEDIADDVSSYLGAPVYVGDEIYGTFCFYDMEPASTEFSEWDVTFVDLLSSWVSAALTRRQTQRELERQNERLDEFASVVSHDLRNPLQVLKTSLDLVEPTADTDHIDRCRRAIDRMERLIDDLLALARGGEEVVSEAPVDVGDIAERCWQTIESEGATLNVEASRVISADTDKLQQLLENLIRNSVEHGTTESQSTDDSGVTITVGGLDSGFYVADDGPGIPPEERDDVLEAGYSTSDDGTGFGLAIVEQVAKLHGWTVEITESDAGGARFEITGVDQPR